MTFKGTDPGEATSTTATSSMVIDHDSYIEVRKAPHYEYYDSYIEGSTTSYDDYMYQYGTGSSTKFVIVGT